MFKIENDVKEIRIYKKGIIYNSHHERYYEMKKYAEIEFFSGKMITLDLEAMADITGRDYLIVKDKGKLTKTLFKNELA